MEKRRSRYVRMAKIAYALAQQTLPRYTHAKSPHRFTFPQLAACVLLMFDVNLSYRDMEEWLLASESVCEALELASVPDHSTLCRAYKRLRMPDLRQMKRTLLEDMGVQEEAIASDATGYQITQASAYYESRRGRTCREWMKGVYAVGTDSQMIVAWEQGRGPGDDARFLNGLRREARRYGHYVGRRRHWIMLADAGFDGPGVQEGDVIPPVRRHGKVVAAERKARADLVAAARLDGLYGQRWKSETVHSVIKRKFGSAIRSRKARHQQREPALKGLVYNIHR
jgi:transposase